MKSMIQKTYYKTKDYCKVKFSFTVENAETVEIVGLNSDWQNFIMMDKRKDGSFSTAINLPKDSKQVFKYRVNETEWLNDPAADAEEPNEYGGSNSVIVL
jgi:1,4-alpha-glucan branching enzyme